MTQMLIDLALGNMCFQHKIDVKPRAEFMSTHAHNVYELIYVINGDLTHTVEDKKYKLHSGDLVLIRPNTYHLIRIDSSEKDYERINIQFDAEDIQADMSVIPNTVNVINTTNHTRISGILSKLDTYAETYEREVFFKMLGGLLTEIVYNISLVDSIETRQETEASNHVIAQAVAYINKNLYTIRSVDEVADAIFVTKSCLFKVFKKELRKGPKRYILDKRLLEAQKLIRSGEKPTSVYEKCGFNDYTTFYRAYVEFFGYAPSKDAE